MTKQKKSTSTDCITKKDLKKIKEEVRTELNKHIWNWFKVITGSMAMILSLCYMGYMLTHKASSGMVDAMSVFELFIFGIGYFTILVTLIGLALYLFSSMED